MNVTQEFDTIAAIATPLGTGGVGVIRISGEKSFDIAKKIFTGKIAPARISHGQIKDNEIILDEVIVLTFKNPHSFTGEDVIEIQCHGGVNVVRNILDLVLKSGARMAERGEFTKRAFLNKKLDLSQAEAVADLIHAQTRNFAIQSAKNLSGFLAQKIGDIKKQLFDVLSKITAGIDFPDEVEEPDYDYLISEFENAKNEIEKILSCAKSSDIMRQGIKVAIVGEPNVGKSSLFNKLLNTERAIVTDIAGTTRDVIKETLDMGLAVTLIDTAGIRATNEKVEEIGIEYSKQTADEADLILYLFDAQKGFEDNEIYELIKNKNHIKIAAKSDLPHKKTDAIEVSSITGEGIDLIKDKIKELNTTDTEFVTNKRQEDCLRNCSNYLENALSAAKRNELQDLISIDLKSALLSLDEITGEVITDEILNNIFDNFCIGK